VSAAGRHLAAHPQLTRADGYREAPVSGEEGLPGYFDRNPQIANELQAINQRH